jgi:CheY-like chemotaxis protein
MTRPNESRILVVDDDLDICLNLTDILTDLGYRVDYALDGPSALELVRQRHYDVALLDLKMPGMDGLALHREIKSQRAGTVSLLVTADAGPATTEEALSSGVWKIVAKPVDLAKLRLLVDEAIVQPLVLVVDDDLDLCDNLWDLLREHGFRVSLAHDGQQAADQLRESTFEVVLIDMRIPDCDSCEVFQVVRESNPRARIILITGYRSEMDQLIGRMVAEGAHGICYKPFDVPELLKKLEQLAKADEEGAGDGPH